MELYSYNRLQEQDPKLFVALLFFTIYGYLVLLETVMLLLLVALVLFFICFITRSHVEPIREVLRLPNP
ncbi:MAG: hypothetical protein P4M11_09415 [Candidatus Pacebacteria bacterium]|nr:hypothetical protein [Candidatus Paceibacterota bacterium]